MSGHVFAIRADLTHLACDDIVVPTDRYLNISDHWLEVLGGRRPQRTDLDVGREVWEKQRFARFTQVPGDGPRVWLVDTGGTGSEPIEWYTEALQNVLTAIAAIDEEPRQRRQRRLTALPLVGVGQGGASAIQTAAPGETELVPTPDGVGSFRPDLTRVPRTPEQEDQWIDQQRYDRLIQHFADRGGVEVHLEAQTLVLRELDGHELPHPVRVRLPFHALSDRFRRAEEPARAVDELIGELDAAIDAGQTDMELRTDGSVHVRRR